MGLGVGMGLNMLLLVAMVATNIFSLYHLASIRNPPNPPAPPVPDHLLRHLSTIRATITHLAARHASAASAAGNAAIPPELIRYTAERRLPLGRSVVTEQDIFPFSVGTACQSHPDLLSRFMNYTAFKPCPDDADLAESLMVHGCFPLPRRRCFSLTAPKSPSSLPTNPFPSSLPAAAVRWSRFTCKSFDCLTRLGRPGFDLSIDSPKWMEQSDATGLTIPVFFKYVQAANSGPIRLGLDIGGGTGTFAARMKERNVTVVSTTLDLGAPYNEVMALRGLVPLHLTMQQRFPLFDGMMDVVHCDRAVNRWIPVTTMEFLFFDIDRVLRGGGILWIDHFFCKAVDLNKVYAPLIGKLGYRRLKWVTGNKTDVGGAKYGEVYLSAILQKPIKSS
ncbi:probable methyltransferase At1g29790 [Nymphaea colorata]|uniref:Methyltransferase type 11 domain-containing protein n=1 Tax=Nymphaea colorata TaxID=210225 RepID=A0A5K1F0U6_9MAGN|nr:probable methyltransferase At1g29790 [Nymphaea colorata]VVW58071.1 unnamed protein product [Nymphaea colorata]